MFSLKVICHDKKEEKAFPNLWYTQLQYLLNYTFVYLGSSTDLLSGHLLLLFEFLPGAAWTPRQTNNASWLSWAAEIF